MARFDEHEEPDYLVVAKPEKDPHSFPNVVREAYALEYGFTKDEQIGDLLGRDKSLISQVFGKDPKKLTVHTIEQLLERLVTSESKSRIVTAWTQACFGECLASAKPKDMVGDKVSDKTLRRIDRQLREHRLFPALRVAFQAAHKTEDYGLRQQFLDRAYFAAQRLDEPHIMMEMAAQIYRDAKKAADPLRLATGQSNRARALLMVADIRPDEIDVALNRLEHLLQGFKPPDPHPPYVLASPRTLDSMRLSALITFTERGVVEPDEEALRTALAFLTKRLKARASQEVKFRDHIAAARLCVLLNEGFLAQEHIEKAFRSGDVKNIHVFPICSLHQGRVMKLTESPQAAYLYLWKVNKTATEGLDFYHKRITHWELTRLANELFPE